MRRRILIGLAIAAVILVTLVATPITRYAHSAALLARVSGRGESWGARMAGLLETGVTTQAVSIPTRTATLRARIYLPRRVRTRPLLLTGGVHAAGIDEPRLAGFARALAAHGTPVVTPELPDLVAYRVTPQLPDQIEDAAQWLVETRRFGATQIGVGGISFSGGLSVVAAARPALRDHVAFTLSLGGHGDLMRVFHYLCTGTQPDGSYRRPHDYGAVVVLLNVADRVVPPAQVQPLRQALLIFLDASHVAMLDRAEARERFAEAARHQRALPEPARTFMGHVNARDVDALGQELLPFVDDLGKYPSLSPERSPAPRSPVHLLHGSNDVVVPAAESILLARYLRAQDGTANVLLTPLITHAELNDRPGVRDMWKLVAFWANLEW